MPDSLVLTPEQERMQHVIRFLLGSLEAAGEDIPGLTTWELVQSMANASGVLLANSQITEMDAMGRIEGLRDISREAFESRKKSINRAKVIIANGAAPSSF